MSAPCGNCAAIEVREAGLREAASKLLAAMYVSPGSPNSMRGVWFRDGHGSVGLVEALSAALAPTAEPIHAVPTKEQTHDSDSEVLRVGQEGVRQLSGQRGGGRGGGANGGDSGAPGKQELVEVHAERLNQDAHHQSGCAEPVRGGQGIPPDVRAGVAAPVAADARPGSAAPPAQQPQLEEGVGLCEHGVETACLACTRSLRIEAAPAQQPETPHKHDSVLAETVCLGCQWEKINAVEAERDALKEKLRTQENRAFNLQRFKDYVHQRLDEEGVPFDPEPEENAEHGCRIEGRLNYLAKEKAALRERLSRAREWTEDDVERVISDAQAAITTTLDNEARAVSKGSAPYADSFRRAALANNVADAIAAALLEIPPEGGEK